MRHLGIFLGYSPNQLDPYQGIARLTCFIIKGALKQPGTRVTIACPAWLEKDVHAVLDDAKIPLADVRIVMTDGEPYALKVSRFLSGWRRPRRAPKSRKARMQRIISIFANAISDWLSTSSPLIFFGGLVVFGLASAVAFIPAVIGGLVWWLASTMRRGGQRIGASNQMHKIRWAAGQFKRVLMSAGAADRLRTGELKKVARRGNRLKDIDVWFVPTMFWPEVAGLDAKVVMAAPDIVFYDHAAQYRSDADRIGHSRMVRSLNAADHLISYSEFVKREHYVKRNAINPEKITVIRHGLVDQRESEKESTREGALSVLHSYIKEKERDLPPYLQGFHFDDVPFIFYSSQARPHKNIEGLIHAYERVLRDHYRPAKLILTANIFSHQRLHDLVWRRGLQADVLAIPFVPNDVLAALYRLATISVNPTLFEGGFPFTFSEAYSVGTPSLMSRIPVIEEVIDDRELLELMTFNPHRQDQVVEKIVWGLDNHERLFRAQAPLFRKFMARPFSLVADEYLDTIQRVSS